MKSRKKLIVLFCVGFAITVLVCAAQGLFSAADTREVLRHLCDGFFVAGLLLTGSGGLIWTYSGGVMDGLGFSAKTLLSLKWKTFGDYRESFAEYRQRREAKKGSPRPYLIAGGCYLAVSLLLFAVYSMVTG